MYLHARLYDPHSGSFITPDRLTPPVGNLGLNRYSYAAGDPITSKDPSGLSPTNPGSANEDELKAEIKFWKAAYLAASSQNVFHKRMAYTDARTGLENNDAYKAYIDELTGARRQYLLGLVDLNAAGKINKDPNFGQGTGDQILEGVGAIVRGQLRPGDRVFRGSGSDEIWIVIENGSPDAMNGIIGRLKNAISSSPIETDKATFTISAAGGWGHTKDEASAMTQMEKEQQRLNGTYYYRIHGVQPPAPPRPGEKGSMTLGAAGGTVAAAGSMASGVLIASQHQALVNVVTGGNRTPENISAFLAEEDRKFFQADVAVGLRGGAGHGYRMW